MANMIQSAREKVSDILAEAYARAVKKASSPPGQS